jgi:hypothetical protein
LVKLAAWLWLAIRGEDIHVKRQYFKYVF